MNHRFAVLMPIATLAAAISFAAPAAAQRAGGDHADGNIIYNFKRGDTLIHLANRYFKRPELYRVVQRQNGIVAPHRIPVGKKLKIARSLLKYAPATARVISVRGRVSKAGKQAKIGDIVKEGMQLSTSPSSYITFQLDDGSRISMPSNSSMKVRLLRRYVLGGSLDYDFAVSKGAVRSKVAPLKSKNDRYRVRSPKAVSAVRGTDYQLRYDAESNSDFAEVLEGGLAVDAGGKNLPLPVGKGLAVPPQGDLLVENLLAAPEIIGAGKTQSKEIVTFTANQKASEHGYRYTIGKDSAFVEVVSDQVVKQPVYELTNLDNGNYFVSARAIASSGLQGLPANFAFRRRLNDVKASADKGAEGFRFSWSGSGQGRQLFHFQLIPGSESGVPVIDETGLTGTQITISDLPDGDYFWRVGSTLFEDNEASVSWTDFEKISLSE